MNVHHVNKMDDVQSSAQIHSYRIMDLACQIKYIMMKRCRCETDDFNMKSTSATVLERFNCIRLVDAASMFTQVHADNGKPYRTL